jgi:hypothetical protein
MVKVHWNMETAILPMVNMEFQVEPWIMYHPDTSNDNEK